MNRTSHKTQRRRQWASFGFIALTMFLVAISSLPSSAQKGPPIPPAPPAGWRFEIEVGKRLPSTLGINNTCRGSHLFRIKSNIKYLRFGERTDRIEVGPASARTVKVLFDATGLKSGKYHDKVIVECIDCKRERTCHQDREELVVDMTVTKAPAPNCSRILKVIVD